MKASSLIWKIPVAVIGLVLGLAVLLVATAAVVIVTPSARTAVLEKAVEQANERTDYDIDLGRLYLSPFHHSPKLLYHAYKGTADLPLLIETDSLFVGHRGQDTLLYVSALRLNALLRTTEMDVETPLSVPVEVERLRLEKTTFHSDSLIAGVGIDVLADLLDAKSKGLVIQKGQFPIEGLRLDDAYIRIDVRETEDTVSSESSPLAFDVTDGLLRNVRFVLTPTGLDLRTGSLATDVLADVRGSLYDVRQINAGGFSLTLDKLYLPFDTLYGDARVDLTRNLITSGGLHARSDAYEAKADLTATAMDLDRMRVEVAGDAEFCGSRANLRGSYDIDNEAYNLKANVQRLNLAPLLKDSTRLLLAGEIQADGRGFDFASRATRSKVQMRLTDCVYDNIDVSGVRLDAELSERTVSGVMHLPVRMNSGSMQISAVTDNQFGVSEFLTPQQMGVVFHSQMRDVRAHITDEDFAADSLQLRFSTGGSTQLDVATDGLQLNVKSPMHVLSLVDRLPPLLDAIGDSAVTDPILSLSDLTMLDTIRRLIPCLGADIRLTKGSPVQHIIDRTGVDINEVVLSLNSDKQRTDIVMNASVPEISHPDDSTALRLPAATTKVSVEMTEGRTNALLLADTRLTDGLMTVHDLRTDANLCIELERNGRQLDGTGTLILDSLSYGTMNLGSRMMDIRLAPSELHAGSLKADIRLDDIPLALVDSIIHSDDLSLEGTIRAKALADGLPAKLDLSGEVLPLDVTVRYNPYGVQLGLAEKPMVMEHNHLNLNGLPVYGVDSTFITLTGGLNLDSMRLDIALAGDSFVPIRLVKEGGALPVYGNLATDIRGNISGPLDSITVDADVTILPTTNLVYPIDEKNLAQVKPYGTVNVKYGAVDGNLNLGGRVNVDEGTVRYSPKIYPIMPFQVDSGSHVTFHGPVGQTMLNVSASQKVKGSAQSEGEDMRLVDFTTGVRVKGPLDSIGLGALDFFLEAPEDEAITEELASLDEETREGLAAALLATGMYMGESNVAAHNGGYALTSIINSRIDAAMTNSKKGKWLDINISSSQNERASGKTNDYGVSLSKSFFNDRFRITVGASVTDNPEMSNSLGLSGMASADFKLTRDGNVLLRAFTQRDCYNIYEGELQKSGLGVRSSNTWLRKGVFRSDTITRTFGLTADADVAYRSNSSLGPDIAIKSSIKNLLGRNETFSVKTHGAYYWMLRNRQEGANEVNDTYKMGIETALVFPYLHWVGDNNPEGDTRYRVGYNYENIAGGYGIHKVSGAFTYFIRSPRSRFVTHSLTPFSLSFVHMSSTSEDLITKAINQPQLLKLIAGDEFIPAVGYDFTYNDYRARRAVNTMIDIEIKEAGNLLNSLYCLFGHEWDEYGKPLGHISFDQFIRLSTELRNKFNLTDKVSIATRLYAGGILPMGNSVTTPLSEMFYAGGTNSMRAVASYSYGPGNYYSTKYNQNFFHAGDIRLEANFELRFPIWWKVFGALFLDAGNVWYWGNTLDDFEDNAELTAFIQQMEIPANLRDGLLNNPDWARQIALGTGTGLRLDLDGLVIRLDLGVGIHAPYQTYRYNKDMTPDYNRPIDTYFNIPSFLDAVHLNFGIGYPF